MGPNSGFVLSIVYSAEIREVKYTKYRKQQHEIYKRPPDTFSDKQYIKKSRNDTRAQEINTNF